MKSFLLIGVGRFGKHLAKKLVDLGNDVVAVDKDAEKIEGLSSILTDAFVGDCTNESVLKAFWHQTGMDLEGTSSDKCSEHILKICNVK